MSNMRKLTLGQPIKTDNYLSIFKSPLKEIVVGQEPNPPLKIKKVLDRAAQFKKYQEQARLSEERNKCKTNPLQ